jgi:hypothetical protein
MTLSGAKSVGQAGDERNGGPGREDQWRTIQVLRKAAPKWGRLSPYGRDVSRAPLARRLPAISQHFTERPAELRRSRH